MKKTAVFMIVVSLAFAGAVRAQEQDAHKKLAEELLVVTKVDQSMERSFEMMRQMQEAQLREMNPGKEPGEKARELQDEIMRIMEKEMRWENLKDGYISVYAETFTDEDLKDIIAFYKSPSGQKFIEKQPELMQKAMQITQTRMQSVMPQIETLSRQLADEMMMDFEKNMPEEETVPAQEETLQDVQE